MNMGRLITQLKRASSVPAGSSYAVAMGDGTGTKQVSHETVVESVKRDLPLGNMEELETENKTDVVGAVNEIIEKLSIVGIAYKGSYNPEAEYNFLDAVFYENSTFIAMKNSPEGEPKADGVNWQYLAKGFMDGYLVAKSQIVNGLSATEPGYVLDARVGTTLAGMLGETNRELQSKQDAATAITTANIGNQSVRHSNSADQVPWTGVIGRPILANAVTTVTTQPKAITVPALSAMPVDLSYTAPSGYSPLGIIAVNANTASCAVTRFILNGSKILIELRNITSGQQNVTISAVVLLKSES